MGRIKSTEESSQACVSAGLSWRRRDFRNHTTEVLIRLWCKLGGGIKRFLGMLVQREPELVPRNDLRRDTDNYFPMKLRSP